jgi:3',5'-cyclic AMP phosphodiesterase CpdA
MCFQHIRQQKDPVDLILNTGDTVMCVNGVDAAEAKRQWNLWSKIVEGEAKLPLIQAIGNHDSWGWNPPTPDEPTRGKAMAIERLGLKQRFQRFDRNGWSFIVLDSIFGSYTGLLDDEQKEWLQAVLAEIPSTQPICVLSHIPIITACGYFDGERFKDGAWSVPGSWMHGDALLLKRLFVKHPNVKLCLSGHMHQIDRVDFNGVSYICSGAVGASWWGGLYYECDYGYSLIDLFDDGGFEQKYVTYGWKTREKAGK